MNRFRLSVQTSVIILSIIMLSSVLGVTAYFYTPESQQVDDIEVVSKIAAPMVLKTIKTPDSNEALTALYSIVSKNKQVKPAKDMLASVWFEQSFSDEQVEYHVVFVKNQMVDPENGEIYGSHADAPVIGAVVYKLIDGNWQLLSKQKEIGHIGSWGDAPEIERAEIIALGKDNIGFLLDISYSGQGYTNAGKIIFSYRNHNWLQLGYLQTSGDNAGVCDDKAKEDEFLSACWRFDGNISLAENSSTTAYPDLQVVRKGTMTDDNGKIIPVKSSIYHFNGEEYTELDGSAN